MTRGSESAETSSDVNITRLIEQSNCASLNKHCQNIAVVEHIVLRHAKAKTLN